MYKALGVVLFTLLSSIPALAKPHDVYPVSCDVLWTAIKGTLGNSNDYSVISINEATLKASFTVVGNLTAYTDTVALTLQDSGCAMKLVVLQVGPDNSDERGFRKRLDKSLAKLRNTAPAKLSVPAAQ